MEHAIVSGGAGFIGSHLCAALLARGLSVTCIDNLSTGQESNVASLLDHQLFTFRVADVATVGGSDLTGAGPGEPSYVFHLASPASVVDYLRLPLETLRVNSQGTWNLLELARRCDARFVFASTSEIYGDPLVHPQAEDYWGNVSPNGPRSCYDESKRFGEALVMQYWRSFGLDCRVVRIFNTYGPHSRLDDGRVVPNFICQALAGKPITIYGDGTQTRSFCYVSDLVDGVISAMLGDNIGGQVFNLGNPEEHTIAEFAAIVCQIAAEVDGRLRDIGDHLVAWLDLPQDDPTRRRPDIEKARQVLGWEPRVTLKDGLRRTITWFRDDLSSCSAAAVAAAGACEG